MSNKSSIEMAEMPQSEMENGESKPADFRSETDAEEVQSADFRSETDAEEVTQQPTPTKSTKAEEADTTDRTALQEALMPFMVTLCICYDFMLVGVQAGLVYGSAAFEKFSAWAKVNLPGNYEELKKAALEALKEAREAARNVKVTFQQLKEKYLPMLQEYYSTCVFLQKQVAKGAELAASVKVKVAEKLQPYEPQLTQAWEKVCENSLKLWEAFMCFVVTCSVAGSFIALQVYEVSLQAYALSKVKVDYCLEKGSEIAQKVYVDAQPYLEKAKAQAKPAAEKALAQAKEFAADVKSKHFPAFKAWAHEQTQKLDGHLEAGLEAAKKATKATYAAAKAEWEKQSALLKAKAQEKTATKSKKAQ